MSILYQYIEIYFIFLNMELLYIEILGFFFRKLCIVTKFDGDLSQFFSKKFKKYLTLNDSLREI